MSDDSFLSGQEAGHHRETAPASIAGARNSNSIIRVHQGFWSLEFKFQGFETVDWSTYQHNHNPKVRALNPFILALNPKT